MTSTSTDRPGRRDKLPPLTPVFLSPQDTPVRTALGAAATGLCLAFLSTVAVVLPVLLAWTVESRSSGSFWQATASGVAGWGLAHRGVVALDGVQVLMAPLLVTFGLGALTYGGVRRVLEALPDRDDRDGMWQASGGTEVSAFVGGYLLWGVLAVWATRIGSTHLEWWPTLGGVLLLPVVAALVALARDERPDGPGDWARDWVETKVPALVRDAVRPAVEGLLALLALAAAATVALIWVRWDRISALHSAIELDSMSSFFFLVSQVVFLPNIIMWVLGWSGGATVEVGRTEVGLTHAHAGDLPLIPVLGILPDGGSLPSGTWLVVLVPMVVGALVAYRTLPPGDMDVAPVWWRPLVTVAIACVAVAVAAAGLVAAANGGMAPGLLSHVGASALRSLVGLGGCLLLGGLLMVGIDRLVIWVQRWRMARVGSGTGATSASGDGAARDRSARDGSRLHGSGRGGVAKALSSAKASAKGAASKAKTKAKSATSKTATSKGGASKGTGAKGAGKGSGAKRGAQSSVKAKPAATPARPAGQSAPRSVKTQAGAKAKNGQSATKSTAKNSGAKKSGTKGNTGKGATSKGGAKKQGGKDGR